MVHLNFFKLVYIILLYTLQAELRKESELFRAELKKRERERKLKEEEEETLRTEVMAKAEAEKEALRLRMKQAREKLKNVSIHPT